MRKRTGWARSGVAIAVVLTIAASPSSARAGDGVIEINQTCAETTGCMPGDAGGFPIEINWRGSYRLTSSLSGSPGDRPVISVLAPYVTIDLNGFTVAQQGIYDSGGGGIIGSSHVTVKNGFVNNATNDGIRLGANSRVSDVEVSQNDRDGVNVQGESIVRGVVAVWNKHNGITAGFGSIVDGCTATGNDSTGISLGSGTLTGSTATQNVDVGAFVGAKTTYASNYFESNGGGDISGGHASAGNFCGDGSCTTDGRKRFYLSRNTAIGSQVLGGCAVGFHVASISEISDPSEFHYDFTRGDTTEANTSRGIPSREGWVRSVSPASTSMAVAGSGNCWAYTSASSTDSGTTLRIHNDWVQATQVASPWVARAAACHEPHHVWCVED